MKKILIAAAIICAATISHAAAFQWSVAGITDHTGAAPSASNPINYTLYAWTVGTDGNKGDAVALTGTYSGSTTMALLFNKTTGTSDLAASTQYYVQLVFTDGDWTYASTLAKTEATPPNGNLTLNFGTGVGFEDATAKVNFSGDNYGWKSDVVPEPTSGLLLLIGMGALALRRKRA